MNDSPVVAMSHLSKRDRPAARPLKESPMPVAREVPIFVPAPARRGRSVAVALAMVAAALVGAGRLDLRSLLPSLPNPFGSKTVDRSQPPLRTALVDLSRYQAASSNLQVIVDSETDASFLPTFVRGERTVFVAAGSVDATVDFSGLDDRSIVVSDGRRAVTVSLPPPVLSPARVDPGQSRVASRRRGLLDRLGSVFSDAPSSEHQLYVLAQQKMEAAAAHDGELQARAVDNTRHMLETMLHSLGYASVTVNFAGNPV